MTPAVTASQGRVQERISTTMGRAPLVGRVTGELNEGLSGRRIRQGRIAGRNIAGRKDVQAHISLLLEREQQVLKPLRP